MLDVPPLQTLVPGLAAFPSRHQFVELMNKSNNLIFDERFITPGKAPATERYSEVVCSVRAIDSKIDS